MDVHFDDAWIRRHLKHGDSRIGRRRVAFDQHGHFEIGRGVFDRGDKIEIVRKILDRRHEHKQLPFPRLNAEGRTCDPGGGFALLRRLCVVRGRFQASSAKGGSVNRWRLRSGFSGRLDRSLEWIGIVGIGNVFRFGPGKRFERQSISHRRIARDEKHLLRCEKPWLAGPAGSAGSGWYPP